MVITDLQSCSQPQEKGARPAQTGEAAYRARDDERRRLSAEIHDGAVQWIIGALYRIRACRKLVSISSLDEVMEELAIIEASLQRSVGDLRRVITDLRPLPLEELGLVAALRQVAARLDNDHISCRFEVDGDLPGLTPTEERAMFGVIQEAMMNARKHSGATRVLVRLLFGEATSAEVIDNGRGFNPEEALDKADRPGHIGLAIMKDRAQAIGARLDIDSHPGQGSAVRLTFRPFTLRTAPVTSWR